MRLDHLLESLPNGLHDAEISRFSIDYPSQCLTCDIEVWIGDMDSPPTERETYRRANLIFEGMEYCAIEPPDTRYDYDSRRPLRIDVCDPGDLRDHRPGPSTAESFVCRMFVENWNAFITICARSIEIAWQGEPYSRHAGSESEQMTS
jgi:hypothetical protein